MNNNSFNSNIDLEVAIEAISAKISKELAKGSLDNNPALQLLLYEREQLYQGNQEVINKILTIYCKEISKEGCDNKNDCN